jgi:integrase
MRPGGEPLNLKWKHVKPFKKPASKRETFQVELLKDDEEAAASDDTYLRFMVSGKTAKHETEGHRSVIARHGVKLWLDQLKELTGRTDDEDYLFCLPDGVQIKDLPHMFTRMLTDCNLLCDADGNRRTLYSLRHTYATYRILYASAPYEILALQMGTSVNMIEQHYSHLKVEDSAELLAS